MILRAIGDVLTAVVVAIALRGHVLAIAYAAFQFIACLVVLAVIGAYINGQRWALRLAQAYLAIQTFLISCLVPFSFILAIGSRNVLGLFCPMPIFAFFFWLLYYHMSPRVEAYFAQKAIRVSPYFISWHFWAPTAIVGAGMAFGLMVAGALAGELAAARH